MNKTSTTKISRGDFLQLSTRISLGLAGILGLAALVRYFSHTPESREPAVFNLGPAGDFPADTKLLRPDIPAVIYQTETGYLAYSLICTHLGCILEESEIGFRCPCHGSVFTTDGQVVQGPAAKGLTELKVELSSEGDLLLYQEGSFQ